MNAAGKPYRSGRGNEGIQKGYEGGGEGVKIGTGKKECNSTVFIPATPWSQHKKRFEGEIKGQDLRRRSLTVTRKNKEHASRKVRPF